MIPLRDTGFYFLQLVFLSSSLCQLRASLQLFPWPDYVIYYSIKLFTLTLSNTFLIKYSLHTLYTTQTFLLYCADLLWRKVAYWKERNSCLHQKQRGEEEFNNVLNVNHLCLFNPLCYRFSTPLLQLLLMRSCVK